MEYYKKGNRFNQLKSMTVNMVSTIGALVALFLFSILEPNWEYNMRCEIDPQHPVSCEYKMFVWPQVIVFLVLMTGTIIFFVYSISKRQM